MIESFRDMTITCNYLAHFEIIDLPSFVLAALN